MFVSYFMQDYHVHAFGEQSFWQLLENCIHEGNIYHVIHFRTVKATGFFRPVSSPIRIVFTNTTTCQQIEQGPVIIPLHKFELKSV